MSAYQFPECNAVPNAENRHQLRHQALKIIEEAGEILAAIEEGESIDRIIEETWDCKHACETLHRAFDTGDVIAMRVFEEFKNDARGYYGERK